MKPLTLSVVVPCFNERETLPELHRRVSDVCRANVGRNYEMVLVNDGSTDGTWDLLASLAARDPHVVAVNLSRNHGHQLALSAGLHLCRGERVFILDCDLQDPPELLGAMMARMDDGCDVVYGQRTRRAGETAFKKASAHLFYRLLGRLADVDIPPDTGDFRLMSRRAVDQLNAMPEQHRFIRGMVSWMGLRQEPLPYERAARFAGETKYPLGKMIRFAVDAITGFSIRPLRLATWLGLFFSLASMALMTYVLTAYFFGQTINGWTSLTLIILMVSAVQFILMGVLGEYVGRLYVEAKKRPLFIVQEVLASPELTAAPKLTSVEARK
jgi:dolichol-phosphate mannosyltransferase